MLLTPGWLRSEVMLDAFGVREDDWRDAPAGDASEPTKEPEGCQSAGAGAQLWTAACALLLGLRRRRYAAR